MYQIRHLNYKKNFIMSENFFECPFISIVAGLSPILSYSSINGLSLGSIPIKYTVTVDSTVTVYLINEFD